MAVIYSVVLASRNRAQSLKNSLLNVPDEEITIIRG